MNHPSNWEIVRFSEIAQKKSIRVNNPKESKYERYVGLEHLVSGELVVKRWGSTQDVSSNMQLFHKNDILFARRNTYLRRVAVALFDGVCSGDFFVIEPILKHVVEGFLPIYMQYEEFENRVIAWSAGAFSKRIKWKQLRDFEVFLPSKDEQQRIVKTVWRIQQNQEQIEHLLKITEKLKRGMVRALLTKGIGHTKFKKTQIGEMPEEWDTVFVSNKKYFELKTGGTPSTSKPEYWKGGIPWLTSGELNRKRIEYTDKEISKEGLDNSNATYIPINSTLIALAGQGKTRGTVGINKIKLTTNQSVAAIIPINGYDSYFLYHLLDNQYEYLRRISGGTGRAGLSLKILSEIELPLPDLNEQKRIADILERFDLAMRNIKEHYSKLGILRNNLTNDFLSGKISMREVNN